MPVVSKLQLPMKQRIALLAVFALGGFVCVVSMIRIKSLVDISRSPDVSWSNPPAAEWSAIEVNVGIICASLPSLKAAITRFFPRLFSSRNGSRGLTSNRRDASRHRPVGSTATFDATSRGGQGVAPDFSTKKMPGFGSIAIATRTDNVDETEMGVFDGKRTHDRDTNRNKINVLTVVEQEVEQHATESPSQSSNTARRPQYVAPTTPGAGDSDSDSEKGLFTPSDYGRKYIDDFERYCVRK